MAEQSLPKPSFQAHASASVHITVTQMSAFSFAFTGDDIEDSAMVDVEPAAPKSLAAETGTLRRSPNSAFPIAGKNCRGAKTSFLYPFCIEKETAFFVMVSRPRKLREAVLI